MASLDAADALGLHAISITVRARLYDRQRRRWALQDSFWWKKRWLIIFSSAHYIGVVITPAVQQEPNAANSRFADDRSQQAPKAISGTFGHLSSTQMVAFDW